MSCEIANEVFDLSRDDMELFIQKYVNVPLVELIETCDGFSRSYKISLFKKICEKHTNDVFYDFTQEFWNLSALDKCKVLLNLCMKKKYCAYPSEKLIFLAIYYLLAYAKTRPAEMTVKLYEVIREKIDEFVKFCSPITREEIESMQEGEMVNYVDNIKLRHVESDDE